MDDDLLTLLKNPDAVFDDPMRHASAMQRAAALGHAMVERAMNDPDVDNMAVVSQWQQRTAGKYAKARSLAAAVTGY